ncbi:MAG: hypothetical protein EBX67_02485 [Betaproteobacteria bacterium]|nr:hypothetical protein [Betaproteobacteria bacterium]NDH34331.1 hypothetical protein [Betaproteobacteria bacterium]
MAQITRMPRLGEGEIPGAVQSVTFFEQAFGLKRRFIHESGYAELDTGAFYINGTNKAIFLADGSLEDGNTIGVMALAAGSAIEAEVKELTPFDKAQEYFRRAAKVKAIYRKPGEARK